ncbi:MAG: biotin/lipoyl-binding protein [Bacilli bacterium]|nr:biotin/lipoyl-binding protein [Bacilli bacterium]
MKVYKVKVNGKLYEVELESVGEVASTPVAAAAPVATPSAPVSEKASLKAPMQGVINEVRVKSGDAVTKGQCLFILEAMKLENEIVSPYSGIVKQVLVQKGQNVANQDVLAIFE